MSGQIAPQLDMTLPLIGIISSMLPVALGLSLSDTNSRSDDEISERYQR
jgi:hypothetical protein